MRTCVCACGSTTAPTGSKLLSPDQRLAPNGYLPDGSVGSAAIGAGAVTNAKIGSFAVDTPQIALQAVGSQQLATNSVIAGKIAAGAVTAAKLSGNVGLWSVAGVDVYRSTGSVGIGTSTPTTALTVLDSIPDNFGTYAGDGVGDDWQVQYFGQPPNANAGPAVDFDHTGQTNLFKYIAGLNPLDPASRFTLSIQPVPGQTGQKNVVFTPRLTGRTYTVTSRPALTTGSYAPLANPSAPSDAGPQRTITDLGAGGAAKFYRVEITKP